jgi:type II secretory pathway component PulK
MKRKFGITLSHRHEVRPEFYFGFPVSIRRDQQFGAGSSNAGSRGVAMLMAIVMIGIMILFASESIVSSQVNLQLAVIQRDRIRAEYAAKSGMNLSTFMLSADLAKDLTLSSVPQLQALGGDIDLRLWDLLNQLPPLGGEDASMVQTFVSAFGLSNVMDSSVIDQLGAIEGSFSIKISDEQQRISVNYCSSGAREPCTAVRAMLTALFSCPAEKSFLAKKRLTPMELSARVQDWVDPDSRVESESGFSDESDPYSRRKKPFKAKNGPLDSIDELKMIEGWDEDVHKVFAPYLTAFPIWKKREDRPKININSAPRELLQCLFQDAGPDRFKRLAQLLKVRETEFKAIAGKGKPMDQVLSDLFGYSRNDPGATDKADPANKSSWFGRFSQTYRIEINASSGDTRRTLQAVIERVIPDGSATGANMSSRSAFRILYWRFI